MDATDQSVVDVQLSGNDIFFFGNAGPPPPSVFALNEGFVGLMDATGNIVNDQTFVWDNSTVVVGAVPAPTGAFTIMAQLQSKTYMAPGYCAFGRTVAGAGQLDNTFTVQGESPQPPSTFALTSDQKLLLFAPVYDNQVGHTAISRYYLDGGVDTSFQDGGSAPLPGMTPDSTSQAVVAPDGQIYIANLSGSTVQVIGLNADATANASFGTAGVVDVSLNGSAGIPVIALAPDGRIVVAALTDGNWAATRIWP